MSDKLTKLREEAIAAFCLAAHCERWEFKDARAHEFFDELDRYIDARIRATFREPVSDPD